VQAICDQTPATIDALAVSTDVPPEAKEYEPNPIAPFDLIHKLGDIRLFPMFWMRSSTATP
jgi:hypothetical protein